MSSYAINSNSSRSQRLPQLSLNQLPEPGKTNSTFSVPQVAWAMHDTPTSSEHSNRSQDNTVQAVTDAASDTLSS